MKKILIALAVLVVGMLGYFTYNKFLSGPAAVGSAETSKIGAALCLTGDCALWGAEELKSIRLAVEEANQSGGIAGKQIELTVEDTQGDPKGAVNAMKKLIEVNHVEAIVGLTWGDSFQAGYTVNNAAHVVAVAPSASLEAVVRNKAPIDYVFSTWVPIKPEIDALQTYMQKTGATKVALLHDQDPFGLLVAGVFSDNARAHGITIIKENEFPIGYDDFRTVITELKASGTQYVFVAFQSGVAKAKFLKQAQELAYTPRLYSTEDIQDEGLLRQYGSALNGVTYVYPEASGNADAYHKNFQARYGVSPSSPSWTNAHDAANVVIAGLKKHYLEGVDLKTAIEQTKIPGTFVQEVQFDANHQLTNAKFQIKTIKNEQFVVVE